MCATAVGFRDRVMGENESLRSSSAFLFYFLNTILMFACEASMQGGEGKVVAKGKIVLLEAFWLCLSALRTSPLLRTSPWSDECAQEYDWTITKKRARFVRFPGWYFRGTYHVRIPCYTMKASTQGFFVPRVKKVKWRPLVLFFLLRFFVKLSAAAVGPKNSIAMCFFFRREKETDGGT